VPIDLSPALYGTVTGRLLAVVGDGPDADATPDGAAVTGTVTFTPDITSILVSNGAPSPFTALPTPIVCGLDTDGYLVYPVPGTHTDVPSRRGVSLLSTTDPNMNPSKWTYVVSFKLQADGKPVNYPQFNIDVPAGATVDLTTATPVPSGTGVYMAQGPRGEKGEKGDKGDRGDVGPAGIGIQGIPGPEGPEGPEGRQGIPGPAVNGESAYQLWLDAGNTGTLQEWLDQLEGAEGPMGPEGPRGPQGIQGNDGPQGLPGNEGPEGKPGQSSYQGWLSLGNAGTMADYQAWLKGPKGDKGDQGLPGATGATGVTGAAGVQVVTAMPATPTAGVLYIVTG
jgi:hypothetical protein